MQRTQPHNSRRGFTLVEMLVVISILLILSYMSLSIYNVAADSDRIRSSARQIQSYLEGARDRAILAGRNDPDTSIGVRFLANPNGPQGSTSHVTVNSMVFVKRTEPITGTLTAFGTGDDPSTPSPADESPSKPDSPLVDGGSNFPAVGRLDFDVPNVTIANLVLQDLLHLGAKLKVYRGADRSTIPQTVFVADIKPDTSATRGRLITSEAITWNSKTSPGDSSLAQSNDNHFSQFGPFAFELELSPSVMPNQEPANLGTGIAIDVANANGDISEYPAAWKSKPYDIMFSPRGTVTGSAAASGLIHLVLRDVADIEKEVTLGNVDDPNREGEELIVTLFTRTGHISSHPVHPSDIFQFAETGQVAQ